MKREIKFRGLRTDGKDWGYGFYYEYDSKSYIGVYFDIDGIETYHNHEVIPESVGQYTGLKDKNGVEIYEGDIVEFKSQLGKNDKKPIVATVEWDEQGMWLPFRDDEYIQDEQGVGFDYKTGFNVTGNIHEHKHLLK